MTCIPFTMYFIYNELILMKKITIIIKTIPKVRLKCSYPEAYFGMLVMHLNPAARSTSASQITTEILKPEM